jgi:flagellar hook-basal body complex protein FliE
MTAPIQGYLSAVNAYKTAARSFSSDGPTDGGAPQQGDFSSLVKSAINEAVKIGERGESLSIAGINDRADISQVVTAVAEAEVALKTVVTVRDKVIDAYKEIIRMPM